MPKIFTHPVRKEFFQKERLPGWQFSDESVGTADSLTMINSHITSARNVNPQWHGATIHSVATIKEHRMSYGVQSATFVQTVFPGQATGTYRLNGMIPTWQKTQITATANFIPAGYRAAGSPPVPYPPRNAVAYYAPPQSRIIANPNYKAYG